jgi:ribose 5-phosphate isomerase B
MTKLRIAIGSDHAGFELKTKLIKYLEENGHSLWDLGPESAESVDYPDYAHTVAMNVSNFGTTGILICGSANGVAMTANKHAKVRAAIAWEPGVAALAKQHNNANIICIPARFVETEEAFAIVDAFLDAQFEGGRHETRVNKIHFLVN